MKRLIYFCLFVLLVAGDAYGASKTFTKGILTGGGTGTLDGIDGATLSDGDRALVISSTNSYTYYLDASSGAAENSPTIIAPDTNPGTKRWILKSPAIDSSVTGLETDSGTTSFDLNTDVYGVWSGYEDRTSTIFSRQTDEAFAEGQKARYGWQFELRDSDVSDPGSTYPTDHLVTVGFLFATAGIDSDDNFVSGAKDLYGVEANAWAKTTGWDDRGVIGLSGNAIQYGTGIAQNEFSVANPNTALDLQASEMQGILVSIYPDEGAWDAGGGDRTYSCLTLDNAGADEASEAIKITNTVGDFDTGIDFTDASVTRCAIEMGTDSPGRTIQYDAGDKSYFLNDKFKWEIGGTVECEINSTGLIVDKLSTDGGATYYELSAAGGIDNVVEDTTPQLGGDLDVNSYDLVSTSNADIDIKPNGTGNIKLDTDQINLMDIDGTTTVYMETPNGDDDCVIKFTGAPTTSADFNTVEVNGGATGMGAFVARQTTSATKYVSVHHDGTDAKIASGSGDIDLTAASGLVNVFGDLSISDSPSVSSHVGNRGYNDTRYAQVATDEEINADWKFGDGQYLMFGDDATASLTSVDGIMTFDNGTGRFVIGSQSGDIYVKTSTNMHLFAGGDKNAVYAMGGSYVKLYYNNDDKLTTLVDGVDIHGKLDAEATITSDVDVVATGDLYAGDDAIITDDITAGGDITALGAISATGACCADYVFYDDYQLLSLDDLQLYTDENDHLPGMTINNTDKLIFNDAIMELLEKTEEQALYILQLHDRLKALEEMLGVQ